jgi:argonaute-like protein implicated in RNA metabolism and viral defense
MKDPVVSEVRRHRMQHTRKFHGDLDAIYQDLLRVQKTMGHKIVNLPPKLVTPTKTSARIKGARVKSA